jgi:hypothetical protein
MTPNPKPFREIPLVPVSEAVRRLHLHIDELKSRLSWQFPDGVPGPRPEDGESANGYALEFPLKPVRDSLHGVLAGFDMIQVALGLPHGMEPSFYRFLRGELVERD